MRSGQANAASSARERSSRWDSAGPKPAYVRRGRRLAGESSRSIVRHPCARGVAIPSATPAPSGGAAGGAHAPVPHASVTPTPRSWTRIVIAWRLGPGLDELDVDVRHRGAEREQGRRRRRRRRRRRVRVAEAEVGDRPLGSAPRRYQPSGSSMVGRPRPCRRGPRSRAGSAVGATSTRRAPASVGMQLGPRSPRRAATACAKQRMPLPLISARLPSALYSTMRAAWPSSALADEQPVGADAPLAVAQTASASRPARRAREGGRRPGSRCPARGASQLSVCHCADPHDTQRHSVAGGERVVRVDVDPAYARVATEPALLAHGELAGAGDDHGRPPPRASTAVEVVEQLLVAECLAGGRRQPAGCQPARPRRARPAFHHR